jgi:hypothetical protein
MSSEANLNLRFKRYDRRKLIYLAAAGVIAITVLLIGARTFLIAVPGAELLMVFAVLAFFFVSIPIPSAWQKSPRWCRIGVLTMVALVMAGHFVKRSETFFPLVSWEMFSSVEHSPVAAVQLKATLRDGTEIQFHPARGLTVLGESRIDTRVREQVLTLERLNPAERATLESKHKATLTALAMMYNRRHHINPITAIGVYRTQAVPPKVGGDWNPVFKYLWTIPVGGQS